LDTKIDWTHKLFIGRINVDFKESQNRWPLKVTLQSILAMKNFFLFLKIFKIKVQFKSCLPNKMLKGTLNKTNFGDGRINNNKINIFANNSFTRLFQSFWNKN